MLSIIKNKMKLKKAQIDFGILVIIVLILTSFLVTNITGATENSCLKLDAKQEGIKQEDGTENICKRFPNEQCLEITFNETTGSIWHIDGCPIITQEASESERCFSCPELCSRNPPENDCNGKCVCPENYGTCHDGGVREIINETSVYCFKGLLLEQKENNLECQNHFECKSNLCIDGTCETEGLLKRLLDWFRRLFG